MRMTKEKSNKTKKKKGLFFNFIKATISGFYGKVKHIGFENIPSEPCIIVGNHAQVYGPIIAEIRSPFPHYTWCIGDMLHLKEFPSYAFNDFWRYKPKWTHWFYKALSYLLAPLGTYIFKNADVIGVYSDMRTISTFKNSINILKEENHLIVFPEKHEEFNHIINEFKDKFVDLARLFHKDTGKELSFVPMYIAPKLKTVIYGKPIKFDSSTPIEDERKLICDYLKKEITSMAQSLPVHTVIPYANISKKSYPTSK